jgi:hypothetical protein
LNFLKNNTIYNLKHFGSAIENKSAAADPAPEYRKMIPGCQSKEKNPCSHDPIRNINPCLETKSVKKQTYMASFF